MDFETAQLITEFRPGLYRHYKGGLYFAVLVSESTTNGFPEGVDVVYFSCTAHGQPTRSLPVKHRDIKEFFSWVPKQPADQPRNRGQKEPRFAYIGYAPAREIVDLPMPPVVDGGGVEAAGTEEVEDIPGISAPVYGVLDTEDGTITRLDVNQDLPSNWEAAALEGIADRERRLGNKQP